MVGARATATRPRSGQFAQRSAARKPPQRPALECIFAHDGPGQRSIEVSERNFFAELKRRNVYKVAVAYAVIAWLLIQAASILFPTFEAPTWVMKVFVALVALGFPIALVIAWAFEITPEGIKRTEDVAPNEVVPRWSKRKFLALIVAGALLAGGLLAFQLWRTKFASQTTDKSI